eukprot:Tbor_TRINITY_DN2632_c0_g1::TRINITY_DN2632_c0_g1_i1::g.17922::m.17922
MSFAQRIRGVFAGSGSDCFNEPNICQKVLELTGKNSNPSDILVAYVGTATYDLLGPFERQTNKFKQMGCRVVSISCADPHITAKSNLSIISTIRDNIANSDVILVSGGNTLYAMARWKALGIDKMMEEAALRGCVLSGGSAGAICWFDGGHSDSMDKDTYRESAIVSSAVDNDEASEAPKEEKDCKKWEYIRVSGLGFLPGLCCPHYDKVQSNGVLRQLDFKKMWKTRHAKEDVICIDHWAALVLDGKGNYSVLSLEGKTDPSGSRSVDVGDHSVSQPWCFFAEACGSATGNIQPLPACGQVGENGVLMPSKKESIVKDPREQQCSEENPAIL